MVIGIRDPGSGIRDSGFGCRVPIPNSQFPIPHSPFPISHFPEPPPLAIPPDGLYACGMTDNPYANDFGQSEGIYDGPPRTSALAVTSLVLSLICCIPGLGVLGAGLGVGALIGIGGSNGRVGGRGLAVAGIIIGALVSLAWVGAAAAVQQATKAFYGSAHTLMMEIESGDYNAARNLMVSPAANATDEQFEAFRDGYRSAYGSFQEIPTGIIEVFGSYFKIGQQIQNYQGTQNLIPIPASFDSGRVLLLTIVSQQSAPAQGSVIPVEDLWVVLPDGTELRLLSAGPAPTPAPTPGGATEADPDEGGADDDEP